jgi:hypothetical protein
MDKLAEGQRKAAHCKEKSMRIQINEGVFSYAAKAD